MLQEHQWGFHWDAYKLTYIPQTAQKTHLTYRWMRRLHARSWLTLVLPLLWKQKHLQVSIPTHVPKAVWNTLLIQLLRIGCSFEHHHGTLYLSLQETFSPQNLDCQMLPHDVTRALFTLAFLQPGCWNFHNVS
ncbi:MAG: hypothetical protein AAGJ35_16415, partial [Myxococcota bacterium]